MKPIMETKRYQGHKDWSHWNVSLWINNDEPLYRMARECMRQHKGKRTKAATDMLQALNMAGIAQTPDGARYTVHNIAAAMEGMQ